MTASTPQSTVIKKLREAGVHTIVYGLGSALQSALGFLLLPLYTTYFDSAAFGVLSIVQVVGTRAGSLFYFGASSALSRSYFDYPDGDERRRVVGTALWITVGGALVQVAFGALAGSPLSIWLFGDDRYATAIVLALVGSALAFVNQLFFQLLRFRRQSTRVVVVNLISLVATVAIIWWLVARTQLGIVAPLAGTALAQGLLLVVLAILSRGDLSLRWSRVELGPQVRLGLAAVGLGLTYYVLDSVDRFLLGKLGTLADVGVYSVGYKIGMVIHLFFIAPFSQIWSPMRMENRTQDDAADLFTHVLTYFVLVGLFITVSISLVAPEIVRAFARRPEYSPGWRVVPIVMLAHLCYGAINIVDYGLWVARKNHLAIGVFVAAIALNVGLNVVLIPRWGYMAAAIVTLVSYAFLLVAVFALADRYFSMRIEPRVWMVLALAIVAMVAGGLVGDQGSTALVVRIVIFAALPVACYFAVLHRYERDAFQRVAATLLGRSPV